MFEDIFSKSSPARGQLQKPKISIIADHREKNSLVLSELSALGVDVEMRHLLVADFLIDSSNGIVAIERKTISDFISSMCNKRLARQLQGIKQYPRHLLVIEGMDEQELYAEPDAANIVNAAGTSSAAEGTGKKCINPNAIRGFLLSIVLEFQVPIIFSKNYEDTARFLYVLAKRQGKIKKHVSIRERKKAFSKKEQLQYILEGFPGIGPVTAKKLLKKFKTIAGIVNAKADELTGEIGKKADVFKLVSEKY